MERLTSALALLAVVAAAGAQLLFAGDQCSTNGVPGVCLRIDLCPSALEDISRGKMPKICTYDKRTPVVCCPSAGPTTPTTTTTTTTTAAPTTRTTTTTTRRTTPGSLVDRGGDGVGQKARRMCEQYASSVWHLEAPLLSLDDDEPPEKVNVSDCAVKPAGTGFIVGGDPADPKEFPHMAAIGFGDGKNIAWLCGGSLISQRYVLTVAHCVSAGNRGPARWVRVGDLNLARTDDVARPQQVAVAERIRHPGYSVFSHYDDIALLRLDASVKFNAYVRPACLHTERRPAWGQFLASGWGLKDWADDLGTDDLRKVWLNAVPTADCSKAYRSLKGTKKLKFGILEDKMVCAGVQEGDKDTCRGDSGGPLQYPVDRPFCMYSVVGLTSFGSTVCGAKNSPAVYTRVSYYVPWIESIVWP